MSKKRTVFCPRTRRQIELEPYLYSHPKDEKQWRYHCPESGNVVNIFNLLDQEKEPIDVHEANCIAAALNEKFGRTKNKKYIRKNNSFLYQAGRCIEEEKVKRGENEKTETARFIQDQNYLKTFCQQLQEHTPETLKIETLKSWWYNRDEFSGYEFKKTSYSQKNQSHILSIFFSFLQTENLLPLINGNPFNGHSDIYIGRISIPETKRTRLTLEQFNLIKDEAEKDGCQWLVNAMDLGLATGLRLSDVVAVETTDICDDVLHAVIEKSRQQLGDKKAKKVAFPLHNSMALKAVISRSVYMAKTATKNGKQPKPTHIIYDANKQMSYDKKDRTKFSGGRTHYAQVTADQTTKTFGKYRNRVPSIAAIDAEKRPTFHEIRALCADLCKQGGMTEEHIKVMLGHSNIEITRHYLANHRDDFATVKALDWNATKMRAVQ